MWFSKRLITPSCVLRLDGAPRNNLSGGYKRSVSSETRPFLCERQDTLQVHNSQAAHPQAPLKLTVPHWSFGAAISLLIGFTVVQTVWYEEYSHSMKHNTYAAWKYCVSTTLGTQDSFRSFSASYGWRTIFSGKSYARTRYRMNHLASIEHSLPAVGDGPAPGPRQIPLKNRATKMIKATLTVTCRSPSPLQGQRGESFLRTRGRNK